MTSGIDNTTEKLGHVTHLECLNCGEKYSLERLKKEQGTIMVNICYDACMGPLDVKYDYEKLKEEITLEELDKRRDTFWKLRELLPVNTIYVEDRPYTPLIESKTIGRELGIRLFLKLDSHITNPTISFKDRPVALAFNRALEADYETVYVASTGNLAIASAHLASETGINPKVYVPRSLGEVKKDAIRRYLPRPEDLIEMDCSYDDTNIKAMDDCQKENQDELKKTGRIRSFVPNNSFRPYYKEGSKTSGMETALQIKDKIGGDETVNIVYPLGSGALFCSAYKGASELKTLGLFKNPVRMWGAQAETCAPIIDAMTTGNILPLRNPQTLAKSIAIGNPGSGYQTLDVIKESNGGGWKVSEKEIFENTLELYFKEGIFSQFVGGVTLAGIKRGVEHGSLKEGDVVVANITGTGKSRIEDDVLEYAKKYGFEKQAGKLLDEVG